MNRFILLVCSFITSILFIGCVNILEPVSLYGKLKSDTQNKQEEFKINIEPLTFSSARKANQDPYIRKLMSKGSGSQANVLLETEILDTKLPQLSQKPDYTIGTGDEVTFLLQTEFSNKNPQLPDLPSPAKYHIGVGDELTFIHVSNSSIKGLPSTIDDLTADLGELLVTKGVVGTNGNVLLLGLGNITVGNRSLSDVRDEVRNILIRGGLTPNFQLEITKFNSKAAYLSTTNDEFSRVIPINNIPRTMQEVVLSSGVSLSAQNKTIINLIRNKRKYRITAKQLLDTTTPNFHIQDGDIIDIENLTKFEVSKSTVDSTGFILLPEIGKIKAKGKTLEKIQLEATRILSERGLVPQFQLELSDFKSKSVYLTINNQTQVVPITNKSITIRELLLMNTNEVLIKSEGLNLFTLKRNGKEFRIALSQILSPETKDIWVQDGDQLGIKNLKYKPGQVFALSGASSANIIQIYPSKRETLSDVLFVDNGALSNTYAQRSEVYLLRGQNPSKAYHLDAQSVSRLLVAAETELRPNDIIFVAERPIISFGRILSEITPLRILLRDIQNNNIP